MSFGVLVQITLHRVSGSPIQRCPPIGSWCGVATEFTMHERRLPMRRQARNCHPCSSSEFRMALRLKPHFSASLLQAPSLHLFRQSRWLVPHSIVVCSLLTCSNTI